MKLKSINYQITEEQYEWLREEAHKNKISASRLLRQILNDVIKKKEDAAGILAGIR